ncbi:MAG: GIY-YIG nuclease family protein [Gemmatimonadota bacterium]|nr:GIY-YIG nuclease family protein [Gemmatimonadota bacterium]
MNISVYTHEQVLGHLDMVLKALASKGRYTKFYIGITNNLAVRASQHERKSPDYKEMYPIYEEQEMIVAQDSFHNLERDAINRFRAGVIHPETRRVMLRCANSQEGSVAKNWLYVLVG